MSTSDERATGRLRSGELRPGMRLGSIELLSELGRGGMGVVLRARDTASGREVAVKTLLAAPSPQQLERFQREGQILATLDHPGIVRVHGGGEVQGRPYLVFELVEGARTLDEAARTLPLEARVRLVRDAARALGHAHGKGVVHRDVKASNLLVDRVGSVRVADFGLAVAADLERLTATGAIVGTPETMAPEQCDGRRGAIAPATDVWGLGVVLYELLTGVTPFAGDSLISIMARVCEARPARPRSIDPQIPRPIEAVVLAALAGDPADRPADGEALAFALDEALAGRGPSRPRRGLVLAAAGAVSVALLLAAGVALASARAAREPADAGVVVPAAPLDATPVGAVSTASTPPAPTATPEVAPIVSAPVAALLQALPERGPKEDILTSGARHLAEQGIPSAMTEYARHLRKARRDEEALRWFRKAATEGEASGMEEAGIMIQEGRGGPRDVVAAELWLELAADRSEADSARRLAFIARVGWNRAAPDLDRAIEMHRRASALAGRRKDEERLELVTALVERGRPGDLVEARAVITASPSEQRKAFVAELIESGGPLKPAGDEAFEERLAKLEGGDMHEDALRRWRARARGSPWALPGPTRLELDALRPLVVRLREAVAAGPPERAAGPARAAAEAGSPEGMLALASCLAAGAGVPADPVAAVAWLERAVAAGEPAAAIRHAELLASRAEPFGLQVERIVALLDLAAALPGGDTPSHRTARADALLVRRGEGDADRAAELLRSCAGHWPASLILGEALAAKRFAAQDEGEARRALEAVLAAPAASALHERARAALAKLP